MPELLRRQQRTETMDAGSASRVEGKVSDVRLRGGSPPWRRSSATRILQWRYRPLVLQGYGAPPFCHDVHLVYRP